MGWDGMGWVERCCNFRSCWWMVVGGDGNSPISLFLPVRVDGSEILVGR